MSDRPMTPGLPRFHDGERYARRRIDSPAVVVRMPDSVGEDLARDHVMQSIEILAIARAALFPMRSAFLRMLDQMGWNR